MIVAWADLPALRGAVTMVDGGFDPLHDGHVAYFEEAAGLGAPLLCNVASDEWIARKHPPLLTQVQRARVIDALRPVAYTHPSSTTTAAALRQLRPRVYAKGADWRDSLPPDERALCRELGIEVVFLDTVMSSSTQLLDAYVRRTEGAPA